MTPGDTLNGGTTTGNVLNLVDLGTEHDTAANLATSLSAVTISGIQTVNILSGEAVNANTASSPAGFTGLTQLNVTEANNGVASTITAAATTNISVTDQSQAGGALSVQGGLNVTVATTEVATSSGSTITVGGTIAAATTAPAGTVTITATAAPTTAGTFQMGAITVYGGTVVSITQTEAGSPGFTTTGGAVTVNGGAATTSVTVDQTAPVLASPTVAGVTDGQVTINDANFSRRREARRHHDGLARRAERREHHQRQRPRQSDGQRFQRRDERHHQRRRLRFARDDPRPVAQQRRGSHADRFRP